jgi:DNA-binding response OmpR family regulator
MRKIRIIVVDREAVILDVIEKFLSRRGYEIMSFKEPSFCPVYEDFNNECSNGYRCADFIITDCEIPRMSSCELLQAQTLRGCKLEMRNKVVMSCDVDDETENIIKKFGCSHLSKPFRLSELSVWLQENERSIDLSRSLRTL